MIAYCLVLLKWNFEEAGVGTGAKKSRRRVQMYLSKKNQSLKKSSDLHSAVYWSVNQSVNEPTNNT